MVRPLPLLDALCIQMKEDSGKRALKMTTNFLNFCEIVTRVLYVIVYKKFGHLVVPSDWDLFCVT